MPKNNSTTLDELEKAVESQESNQVQNDAEVTEETKADAQPDPGYKPAENEKHLYHVELERPHYDKTNGKKLSKPVIQKFTKKEYNQLVGKSNAKDRSNAEMLGYTIKVLYKPE